MSEKHFTSQSSEKSSENSKPRKVEHYVPIRTGVMEYLLRGDISAFEFGVYVIVHLQANYATGIWLGSAPRIFASAPRGAKLRDIQRALEHLADLGLLKHFHRHGRRGNFQFLINKFTVRSGALTGMRLNADKSESWQGPVYEPCAVDPSTCAEDALTGTRLSADKSDSSQPPEYEPCAKTCAEDAPFQEVRSSKNKAKAEEAAAPANQNPKGKSYTQTSEGKSSRVSKVPWEAICEEKSFGPQWFVSGWEKAYADRPEDESLSDTMEEFAQACQAKGLHVPKPFFDLKRLVEAREAREAEEAEERRPFGASPFPPELMR